MGRPNVVKCIVLVLVACALASCVSDQASRYYASEKYPPRPVDEVEVLYGAPSRPYEVIADFQAMGETAKGLRRKAARIGADAVIVVPLGGSYSESEEWAGQDRHHSSYTRMTGTAIRYK